MKFEELVNLERDKQDQKWGEQNHGKLRWYTILGEEVGELAKAILESQRQPDGKIEVELIHCAAVLKAMYESGKRNGWL